MKGNLPENCGKEKNPDSVYNQAKVVQLVLSDFNN